MLAIMKVKASQSSFWGLVDYSPGQATEVGSLSLPQGSSQPRDQALVSSLQADSLPAELQGKPKNTGVGSLSLLQQIFPPTNQTGVSCIAGGFFSNWAMGKPWKGYASFKENRYYWKSIGKTFELIEKLKINT